VINEGSPRPLCILSHRVEVIPSRHHLARGFGREHGAYPAGTWIRSPHMSHHRPFTESEGATILVKVGHLQVPA